MQFKSYYTRAQLDSLGDSGNLSTQNLSSAGNDLLNAIDNYVNAAASIIASTHAIFGVSARERVEEAVRCDTAALTRYWEHSREHRTAGVTRGMVERMLMAKPSVPAVRVVECPECHTSFEVPSALEEYQCPRCSAWSSDNEDQDVL